MQKGSIIRSTFSIWHDVIIKSNDYAEILNHKPISKKANMFYIYSRIAIYTEWTVITLLFDTLASYAVK